jgi:hypothetical protein
VAVVTDDGHVEPRRLVGIPDTLLWRLRLRRRSARVTRDPEVAR